MTGNARHIGPDIDATRQQMRAFRRETTNHWRAITRLTLALPVRAQCAGPYFSGSDIASTTHETTAMQNVIDQLANPRTGRGSRGPGRQGLVHCIRISHLGPRRTFGEALNGSISLSHCLGFSSLPFRSTTNQAAIAALFRVVNRYVGNLAPIRRQHDHDLAVDHSALIYFEGRT